MTSPGPANPDRPRYWVWPLRPPRVLADAAWAVACFPDRLTAGWWWLPVAVALGGLPVLLAFVVGTSAHQLVSGLLTAWLVLTFVRRDHTFRGIAFVAVVFAVHSAVVITLTVHDADRAAAILPRADDYWQRVRRWVVLGEDDEYRWYGWLPEHLALLAGVPILAFTTLGGVPFFFGFEQVDLMNYYVGRLIPQSRSPLVAVLLGWHPWSVLRGLAFTLLTFEAASCSLERLTGRTLSSRRRRAWRWAVGICLALADGLLKQFISPLVQQQLHANLLDVG